MGPIYLPFRYPKGKWMSMGNWDLVTCFLYISLRYWVFKVVVELGHPEG